MKIMITGTPGTGKTTLAKALGKKLKIPVINEKQFCLSHQIGKWDQKGKELEVDPKKLEKALQKVLKSKNKVILEGHLLCETKLEVDKVILLHADLNTLEKRLWKKNYLPGKILDNLYAEDTSYCEKMIKKNYSKNKIMILESSPVSQMIKKIVKKIQP